MINILDLIWEEKYRPKVLDDLIIPDRLKMSFAKMVDDGAFKHMLFYSESPGTGKTSSARLLCELTDTEYILVNASKDNSIANIRTDIESFSSSRSMNNRRKCVILDEADRLSAPAQDSLKGIFEDSYNTCSFILTTNSKSRLIDPILSRCELVEFVYSGDAEGEVKKGIVKRLMLIGQEEGLYTDSESKSLYKKCIIEIAKSYYPDIRKMIATIQQCYKEFGIIDERVFDLVSNQGYDPLFSFIQDKNYTAINEWVAQNYSKIKDEIFVYLSEHVHKSYDSILRLKLVMLLDQAQKTFYAIPDRSLAVRGICASMILEIIEYEQV